MRQILTLLIALVFLISCEKSKTPTRDVFRGNPIAALPADGVLRVSGSPYLATVDLRVPAGQTLTIEPGVELRFEPAKRLTVEGCINAVGSEAAPITFTSGMVIPRRGDWDGVWLESADNVSRFEYCRFLFGALWGRHKTYEYDTTGAAIDSAIAEYGSLTLKASSPTIKRCWFLAGGFSGVHIDAGSNPTLENCIIYDNAFHGVWVHQNADPLINYCIISENDDYGVKCAMPGDARRADLNLNYSVIIENFSGEFDNQSPLGFGRIFTANSNLDSCDYRHNLRLNPEYVEAVKIKHRGPKWDFRLQAWSAAIDAGPEGLDLESDGTRRDCGIHRYQYRPGEIRRRIPNLPIVGNRLEAARSPYYMSCDVLLPVGDTLFIEPGVEIRIEGRFVLRAKGCVKSNGTAGAPVKFISARLNPQKGEWQGIVFEEGGASGNELHYTQVFNARWGLKFVGRDALVNHCKLAYVDSVGILCEREAAPTITDCEIIDASIAGVLCQYNSSPLIRRNIISSGSGYGILARESSQPRIVNNIIDNLKVNGVRLENMSNALLRNNVFIGNGYSGVHCFNNSSPDVRNNIFYNNGSVQRGGYGIFAERTSRPAVAYNAFYLHDVAAVSISKDTTRLEATNLHVDPRFVDLAGKNYRLADGSPCLNAGDPTILDADGSPSDMGAFGGPDAP